MDRIANELNDEGIKTRLGYDWRNNGVLGVLRNYSYTGNLLLQKYYREDHITKRSVLNDGKLPQYHAQDTHEPIISLEDFRAVQDEIERRSRHHAPKGKKYYAQYPFSGLIVCGNCGKKYRRKVTRTGAVWICSTFNHKGKAACASKQIPEAALKKLTADLDLGQIARITANDGNQLVFRFLDGHECTRRWEDRSRSESWTVEMKECARLNAKKNQEANEYGNS